MYAGKVLLLSDGSEIFSALNRFFVTEGYQTATAHNNQDASEAVRRGDFHLLVTRVNGKRPELLALLQSIRQQHPRITTIILRGEHEVNSPIEAFHLQEQKETFIPCGWPGLRRLLANCLSG